MVGVADLLSYPVTQAAGGIAGVAVARMWGPAVASPAVQ
jgi:hypothetical protein